MNEELHEELLSLLRQKAKVGIWNVLLEHWKDEPMAFGYFVQGVLCYRADPAVWEALLEIIGDTTAGLQQGADQIMAGIRGALEI